MTTPSPPYAPEHEALRAAIRVWIATELAPHADAWETDEWFPHEVFTGLARRGWLGLDQPPEHGGEGAGPLAAAVLAEELGRCGSGGVAAGIGAHVGIAMPPLAAFGTMAQRERWLEPAIRGERVCALGITEPDAGSDVAGLRTRAERVDGGWVVNGAKTYITNGARADVVVTAVRTRPEGGHHGISFLVLERGMEGFSVARRLQKLGWHASDTAELAFADVFVGQDHLLGREHEGFTLIMANFQWERLLLALGAVGAMDHLVELTAPLADGRGGAARHALAEMALELAAGRALTLRALALHAGGHDALAEVTEAKLLTQRGCVRVAERAFVLHERAGSPHLGLVDRALRDARLGPIGGGTDEVMKEILGKVLAL